MLKDLDKVFPKVIDGILVAAKKSAIEEFPVLDLTAYFKNGLEELNLDKFNYHVIERSKATKSRIKLELESYVNQDQIHLIMEYDHLEAHLSSFFRKMGVAGSTDVAYGAIKRAFLYAGTKKKLEKKRTIFSDAFWFNYLKKLVMFYCYGSTNKSPFITEFKENPWTLMNLHKARKSEFDGYVKAEAINSPVFSEKFKTRFPDSNLALVNKAVVFSWVAHFNPELIHLARKRRDGHLEPLSDDLYSL